MAVAHAAAFPVVHTMRLFYFIFFAAIFSAVVITTGFYPIVFIDYTPALSMRTWKRAEMGARNFTNAGFLKAGKRSIDFRNPLYDDIRNTIARDTLIFLVEDEILSREGKKKYDEFEHTVEEKIKNAVAGKTLTASVGKLYGFTFGDFETFVLYPQARREVMRDDFGDEEQFAAWFEDAKKKHRVNFFFMPYTWEGGGVKNPSQK